jgi:hypothetical protein
MTFKNHLNKVNLVLVLALLAALLVPVIGFAAGETVAFIENLDAGAAENAHTDLNSGIEIACACGDPGGGGSGSCC